MSIKIVASRWAQRYNLPELLELEAGASISDALCLLPVPAEEVGLASVNGAARKRDSELCDGDELELFPVLIDG